MPQGIKGFIKGHIHSNETKLKIGMALSKKIEFKCDMCHSICFDNPASYKRKKSHFCSRKCYSEFKKKYWTPEMHYAFGSGMSKEEKHKRIKARGILNHYLRDKNIIRPSCNVCGHPMAEAHHHDYDRPLDVVWLCFRHHREIHQHSELLS